MSDLNVVIMQGRLVRDAETRDVGQSSVTSFSIALGRKFKVNGEEREETAFVDCVAWAASGQTIQKFFTKGKPICIRGRLKTESWDDKTTGKKRSKLVVIVDEWTFPPSSKSEDRGGQHESPGVTPVNVKRAERQPAGPEVLEEEAPFDDSSIPF